MFYKLFIIFYNEVFLVLFNLLNYIRNPLSHVPTVMGLKYQALPIVVDLYLSLNFYILDTDRAIEDNDY